jgi:hypothetical protein
MNENEIINFLLSGDVSIQYQAHRDLLGSDQPGLQNRIETEGWGAKFLSFRKSNGHWGLAFYQPKWISTHYTLLDLKNLQISPGQKQIKESLDLIFRTEKAPDGGIKPIGMSRRSDMCINGMVLNYASYFGVDENKLQSVIDCLLSEHLPDGGFNCQSVTRKVAHSSLHTTLSVLEGILEYKRKGHTYRLKDLEKAEHQAQEFLLMHHLFRSDKTGVVIRPGFLKLHYPDRWYYNILRALEYFQFAGLKYDNRMDEAIEIILKKRSPSGMWLLPAKIPGQTHFDMEKAGQPSRWNTLRALRVLKHFNIETT